MSQQNHNTATGPSSSSVSAKRTPAQREKKRAQDRQSQRNVRNRTKQHIASLEARVNELSSYEGLNHLISANEDLRAQNDELITTLRSIASLVERVCGLATARSKAVGNNPMEQRFRSPSWTTPSESPEGQNRTQRDSLATNDLGDGYGDNNQGRRLHSMSATSPRSLDHQDQSFANLNPDNGYAFETRTYPMYQKVESESRHASLSGPSIDPHDLSWDASGMPTVRDIVAQGLLYKDTSSLMTSLATINRPQFTPYGGEIANAPKSQICPPTNSWDAKLTAFIRQHRASTSAHFVKQVAEPCFPDVDILVYPERFASASDPITQLLANVMLPWNFQLPERLAFFYLNYIFIKWAIAPTPANTMHLPDWYLPKPPQSETSHPLYVDTIPWPEMRNKITFQYPNLNFVDWVTSFCHNLNVSWKHDPALTYTIELDGTTRISPALHLHLRELSNWILNPPFAAKYPYLALET